MAAQTLSEYFIEYRNGVNPVTGEQRLYKDITDQMIWDAAIKAAEEKFNPSNNGMELTSAPQSAGSVKYEIALCVFQDYKAFCDECESNYMPFPEFCKKHIDVGA